MKQKIQSISDKLNLIFGNLIQLPENYFVEHLNLGELKEYKKNHILKNQFETETTIRFLITGSCGYFINNNDTEKCIYFIFENDIVVDYISFVYELKTELLLKTLENTEILEISKYDYFNFINNNTLGEKIHRIGLELLYFDTQQQYFDILTLTATERYLKLLSKQKNIAQKIDHKHIASFLGITPQSLSRLRKKLLH